MFITSAPNLGALKIVVTVNALDDGPSWRVRMDWARREALDAARQHLEHMARSGHELLCLSDADSKIGGPYWVGDSADVVLRVGDRPGRVIGGVSLPSRVWKELGGVR